MSKYEKLAKAKKEFGKLVKNSDNPYFKSKYADLNALLDLVEEPLANNGLILVQPVSDGCVTSEIIEVETGEAVCSSFIKLPELNDPQKLGSAITYFRRYTLQSMLALAADDDDGNKASNKKQAPLKKAKLTDDQFKKLLLPENFKHIETALDRYEMSEEARNTLLITLEAAQNESL